MGEVWFPAGMLVLYILGVILPIWKVTRKNSDIRFPVAVWVGTAGPVFWLILAVVELIIRKDVAGQYWVVMLILLVCGGTVSMCSLLSHKREEGKSENSKENHKWVIRKTV